MDKVHRSKEKQWEVVAIQRLVGISVFKDNLTMDEAIALRDKYNRMMAGSVYMIRRNHYAK